VEASSASKRVPVSKIWTAPAVALSVFRVAAGPARSTPIALDQRAATRGAVCSEETAKRMRTVLDSDAASSASVLSLRAALEIALMV